MTTATSAGDVTVTQRLLCAAAGYGARPALISRAPAQAYSYAELAFLVKHAAAGLAWRGVRPRDVVGVYVPDAARYLLSCHAIRAAGGVPSPVTDGLSIAEVAGQLADCGARMLITAPPLAMASIAAADRSWVRQVICFGDAPGATPFDALLGVGALQPARMRAHDLALLAYRRRADGVLGQAALSHMELDFELARLAEDAPVGQGDVVLATPPAGDGRAYSAYLNHVLLGGAKVVATPADEVAAAASEHSGTAAIIPTGARGTLGDQVRVFAVVR
jgi:non-ribosomal peptide synthetase component E (peptide arylation enzyme)